MDFDEPETVQVRINGINLKKFIETELLVLLEKEFGDIKAVNLTFITTLDDDKKEMISIGYPFLELEEKNQLIIDANEPESLKKVINVLKEYKK